MTILKNILTMMLPLYDRVFMFVIMALHYFLTTLPLTINMFLFHDSKVAKRVYGLSMLSHRRHSVQIHLAIVTFTILYII